MPEMIGVAFPATESGRRALRAVFPNRRPIPPAKPGSVRGRCARCAAEILIGPRLAATGLPVICVLCAHTLGILPNVWPHAGGTA